MTSIKSARAFWSSVRRFRHGKWTVREIALVALGTFLVLAVFSWGTRLALAPTRRASPHVSLAAYGYPGVEMSILYPARISYRADEFEIGVVSVYTQADSEANVTEIELFMPLPNETVTFVDAQGLPVPGRLTVMAGYPDALPESLLLSHTRTQLSPLLLRARTVRIVPNVRTPDGIVPIPGLAFRTRLESRLGHALRQFVMWFSGWGLLLAAMVAGTAPLWMLFRESERKRRLAREQRLSALYTRLRDEIKVENWDAARNRVEELRLLAPAYRDLDQLDTLISTAETASWRRDQLYSSGLNAYRKRDWPTSVQAFRSIEEETPYHRDVRFLHRTAALYADLRSRDRSLRLTAATQLGEVADLLDMQPLLQAMGDRSNEVADAAEASFSKIGPPAIDTLISGLAADTLSIRERSYRLLQSMGQSARDALLGALHSPDSRITMAAARLLRRLGAREELAQALLWAAPEHHAGIVESLVEEGEAATEPLVNVLLQAQASQQQVVLRALGALKVQVDITRYLESRARSAGDSEQRQLLQRAVRVPAEPFVTVYLTQEVVDAESITIEEEPAPEEPDSEPEETEEPEELAPRSLVRRLGWPERWQR